MATHPPNLTDTPATDESAHSSINSGLELRAMLIAIIAIVTLALALGAWAVTIYQKTIVAWWVAPLFGMAISTIFMRPMLKVWSRITPIRQQWVLGMIQTVTFTSIGAAAMLASNYYAAEQSTEKPLKVVVESRHKTTNYPTRRVGRHMVSTGKPYNTYSLTLRFPSGLLKKPRVSTDVYLNVRPGDTITVTTRHGWLDWPVYEPPTKVRPRHKKSSRRRSPASRGNKPIPMSTTMQN